jgi:hypothetical protein
MKHASEANLQVKEVLGVDVTSNSAAQQAHG